MSSSQNTSIETGTIKLSVHNPDRHKSITPSVVQNILDQKKPKKNSLIYKQNSIVYSKQKVIQNSNVYPEDYTLHRDINLLFRRIHTSVNMPDLRVYNKNNEINAFVYPDGQIFISRGLINICESEEEIMAVLAHEIRHFQEEHHEQTKDDALSSLGATLMHEWQADIGGLIDLDKSGINPYGATILFKKLSNLRKKHTNDDFSITHGSALDRFINTHASARLYDFQNISSKELTPFDPIKYENYNASYANAAADIGLIFQKYSVTDREAFVKKVSECKKLTLIQSLQAIAIHQYNCDRTIDPIKSIGKDQRNDDYDLLFRKFTDTIENFVFMDDDFTDEEKSFIYGFVLQFSGTSLSDPGSRYHNLCTDIRDDFYDLITKSSDITSIVKRTLEFFTKHELFVDISMDNFAEGLVNHCVREGIIFDKNDNLDMSLVKLWLNNCLHIGQAFVKARGLRGSLFDQDNIIKCFLDGIFSYTQDANALKAFARNEYGITVHFTSKADPHSSHDEISGTQQENIDTLTDDWQLRVIEMLDVNDLRGAMDLYGYAVPRISQTQLLSTVELMRRLKVEIIGNKTNLDKKKDYKDQYSGILLEEYLPAFRTLPRITAIELINDLALDKLEAGILLDKYFESVPMPMSFYELDDLSNGFLARLYEVEDALDIKYRYEPNTCKTYEEVVELSRNIKKLIGGHSEMSSKYLEYMVYSFLVDSLKNGMSATEARKILARGKQDKIISYNRSTNILRSFILEALVNDFISNINSIESSDELQNIWEISNLLSDGVYRETLQKTLMKRMLDRLDFEEGFEFIFSHSVPMEMIETFIDIKAKTHTQIERCKKAVLEKIEFNGEEAQITQYHVAHILLERIPKSELLRLALSTWKSDLSLKRAIGGALYRIPEPIKIDVDNECEKLYLMSEYQKIVFLRVILTGKRGILHDGEAKRVLLNDFITNHVQNPDGEIEKEIIKVLKMLSEEANIEDLYFLYSSILKDRIFRHPRKKISFENVIGDYPYEISSGVFISWSDIAKHIKGSHETKESRMVYEKIESLCGGFQRAESKEKMDAAELIIQIASQLGSIGIRFLQIMGQYIKIPKHLEGAFNDVYDNVNGQSKLVAHTSLMRDWPEFSTSVNELNAPVGGGSIVTVYEAKDKYGVSSVIKVMNPSFKFQYEKMFDTLKNIFGKLAEVDRKYTITLPIINDIKLWIESDTGSQGFLKKDQKFYKKWNGWKQKKSDRYAIKIPKSYPPEIEKFKREEFIIGENLTKYEKLKSEGHDISAIAYTIIAHYIEQIKDGQIHSDLHIGNFRITANNEIAVLDRNFYLEIDLFQKLFIKKLFDNKDDANIIRDHIASYLGGLKENEKIDVPYIVSHMEVNNTDGIGSISTVLTTLRKNRVYIPLWITLLVKNLNALYALAKTANIDMEVSR